MNCVACEEPITNPLCPHCIQKGITQWLHETGNDSLVQGVDDATKGTFLNVGDTHCIKCHRMMELCAYCYTKEIFLLIRTRPELLEQYLTYFNYDLGHLGWEREARACMNL